MNDPPRWNNPESNAPDGARDLLASARRPRMSPEARARGAARVASLGTTGSGGGGSGSAPGRGSWFRAFGKATVGLATLVGGALLAHHALFTGAAASPPSRVANVPPPLVVPAPTAAPPHPPEPAGASATAVPPPEAPPTPTPSANPVATATPTAPATSGERAPVPGDELRLLEEARHAVDSNPAVALDRVRQLARWFPRSGYAQEREFIAVRALVRARRGAEARARGERFVARYPNGIYTASVRRLLEGVR